MGLVWNRMMSMAGGWFFLMISESFQLANTTSACPDSASYMSVAVEKGDVPAMLWAILAMIVMIVALDQFLWRPVVVWAQKFRIEEGGAQPAVSSWFLDWLRRSTILAALWPMAQQNAAREGAKADTAAHPSPRPWPAAVGLIPFALLLGLLVMAGIGWCCCSWSLLGQWGETVGAAGVTLGRVLLSTVLGTLWALPQDSPLGCRRSCRECCNRSSRWRHRFPRRCCFRLVIAALDVAGVPLGWGSILLMLHSEDPFDCSGLLTNTLTVLW